MTSILANAVELAFRTAALVAGQEVVYCRGAEELTITAVLGSQTIQQVTEYENLLIKRWRESFLAAVADLAPVFGEPQAGDLVKLIPPGRDDVQLVFTVRPDEAGGPAFRPSDRFHTRWRLNTILTGKESLSQ